MTAPAASWQQYLNRRMLICVFTGFASGMPLFVLIQLIPVWLREGGVSLTQIGLLSLAQLPYSWKFIWAPFMDRWSLSTMGRRRSPGSCRRSRPTGRRRCPRRRCRRT